MNLTIKRKRKFLKSFNAIFEGLPPTKEGYLAPHTSRGTLAPDLSIFDDVCTEVMRMLRTNAFQQFTLRTSFVDKLPDIKGITCRCDAFDIPSPIDLTFYRIVWVLTCVLHIGGFIEAVFLQWVAIYSLVLVCVLLRIISASRLDPTSILVAFVIYPLLASCPLKPCFIVDNTFRIKESCELVFVLGSIGLTLYKKPLWGGFCTLLCIISLTSRFVGRNWSPFAWAVMKICKIHESRRVLPLIHVSMPSMYSKKQLLSDTKKPEQPMQPIKVPQPRQMELSPYSMGASSPAAGGLTRGMVPNLTLIGSGVGNSVDTKGARKTLQENTPIRTQGSSEYTHSSRFSAFGSGGPAFQRSGNVPAVSQSLRTAKNF